VLTIAGSDSGGAAGLQADLKTFTAIGVYGMSVVTVVTAQNSVRVAAVHNLPAEFVAAQLDAVLSDYGAAAVKTGFVGRVDLMQTIAHSVSAYHLANIVIDPVLVNHRGEAMFPAEVTQAYVEHLVPLANLVTPNRREAALLTGRRVESLTEMATAAIHIHALGAQNVLVKGGQEGNEKVDVFFDGRQVNYLRGPRIETQNTHGSGDTLSAAIGAYLAQGMTMAKAIAKAHHFTAVAIEKAATWQLGQWPVTSNQ
jgi:hydroxymethylpyrimidine/phosphomethylpyrimidine kinase